MLNQGLDGSGASKPHGMVKCGNAVFVGSMDVRSSFEQRDEPLPLVSRVWILFGANFGQRQYFHNARYRLTNDNLSVCTRSFD
jgi:hypothetical protein